MSESFATGPRWFSRHEHSGGLTVVEYDKGSAHVLGGVRLDIHTGGGARRSAARAALDSILEGLGGVGWDVRGDLVVVVPRPKSAGLLLAAQQLCQGWDRVWFDPMQPVRAGWARMVGGPRLPHQRSTDGSWTSDYTWSIVPIWPGDSREWGVWTPPEHRRPSRYSLRQEEDDAAEAAEAAEDDPTPPPVVACCLTMPTEPAGRPVERWTVTAGDDYCAAPWRPVSVTGIADCKALTTERYAEVYKRYASHAADWRRVGWPEGVTAATHLPETPPDDGYAPCA